LLETITNIKRNVKRSSTLKSTHFVIVDFYRMKTINKLLMSVGRHKKINIELVYEVQSPPNEGSIIDTLWEKRPHNDVFLTSETPLFFTSEYIFFYLEMFKKKDAEKKNFALHFYEIYENHTDVSKIYNFLN
jgi:hypothetical protein